MWDLGTLAAKVLHSLGTDRAVAYLFLARAWTLIASPVTLILVASHLTPEMQGYYYTFASLLALQSFVELGFALVVVQFASHEWAHLRLDPSGRIMGNAAPLSRLASLCRLVFRWYAAASAIFIGVVSVIGYFFFLNNPVPDIEWRAPWLTLVLLSGLQLWVLPFISLLEGCNQVVRVGMYRLVQAVLSTFGLWGALSAHWDLWVAAVPISVTLVCNLILICIPYRKFFESLLSAPITEVIHWKTEIWPMQWRVALGGVVSYFAFFLYTPVMFHYHGAVTAGQMGMTWALTGACAALALPWINTKVPQFGMLISQKKYTELDRLFFRASLASLAVITCGAIALWLIVYGLYAIEHSLSARILPPLPTALLLISVVLMQISQCETAYLRAHKRDPLVVLTVIGCLMTGVLVWLLGSSYGVMGAAIATLAVTAFFVVPYETAIWFRCRTAWHKN